LPWFCRFSISEESGPTGAVESPGAGDGVEKGGVLRGREGERERGREGERESIFLKFR
jgi:hypothetical protein